MTILKPVSHVLHNFIFNLFIHVMLLIYSYVTLNSGIKVVENYITIFKLWVSCITQAFTYNNVIEINYKICRCL